MVNDEIKKNLRPRVKRVLGQIEGVSKMIEDERYCIDIINQVNAARRALEQVALIIMKQHMNTCLTEAIKSKKGQEKIDELVNSIDTFIR
ncbi:MAG: transcriptional regulator [Deltaproteobacteria bacterium CG07_land_8_20_14_0_80_38_7]|nr:MAG: transcriptional regulator [Deltaproteobacteria bacterium CG07_land_8_20_14_0_80_38_7]